VADAPATYHRNVFKEYADSKFASSILDGEASGPVAAVAHVSRRARSRARGSPLALSDDNASFIGIG
jgi:hypothetical protein